MNRQKTEHKGFTLIEVIITIAILGIVLSVVGQFFTFNLRTFYKGEKLAQVQFDVRMASDFITSELRNVMNVSEATITDGLSIDLSTLQAKYPLVTTVDFEFVIENGRVLVEYEIGGNSTDGKNPFTVESKILLNNDRHFTGSYTDSTVPFNTIYYKK